MTFIDSSRPVVGRCAAEATTRIVATISTGLEVRWGAGASEARFGPDTYGSTLPGRPGRVPEAS